MKNRILLTLCAVRALTAFSAAPALATHDTEPKTLSVSRSGGGAVTGGGIDCGATCAVEDQPGEECEYVGNGNGTDGPNDRLVCSAIYHDMTLTAHNQNGWALSDWGGACTGAGATCTLTVKVADNAGHSDTFTRSVVIDGVASQTTITGGTADGASSTATSASFELAADQAGSTFKCRVYPAALTPGAFGPCSGATSHSASGFSPGTYAFEVVSTDPYGNLDATPAKRTFTGRAPTTTGGGGAPTGGRIDAKINTFWKLYGKRRLCLELAALEAHRELELGARHRRGHLAERAKITIVIAKDGWIPKTFRYTTRPGKFPRLTLSQLHDAVGAGR